MVRLQGLVLPVRGRPCSWTTCVQMLHMLGLGLAFRFPGLPRPRAGLRQHQERLDALLKVALI